MNFPRGRELVLGVGAGIAAYKSADLLRRLQDRGFLVTVVPTPNSLNFVGKATWEALSGRKAQSELWENVSDVPHVSLGDKANLILVAPATADLIARIAHGRADDLLTNTILSTTAPIVIVPAMHPKMWLNPATVKNVQTLRDRGVFVMDPAIGRLTGSDSGVGRFPDSSAIIDFVEESYGYCADLLGARVLVTAGGTREAIDPVRFIGNRSSGKQGWAIANQAAMRGAQVTLVLGPNSLPKIEGIETVEIESAAEMRDEILARFDDIDVLVMSAAVADARPVSVSDEKIKKEMLGSLLLEENQDLLAEFAAKKRTNQVIAGFAAETESNHEALVSAAKSKLARKGADLIYVNDVSSGKVFGSDMTSGAIITREGKIIPIEEVSKEMLADTLLDQIRERVSHG
ncbi:MAG: bifunctional phosphopantothenoylcysteine decarboxylase/phosphopantothenate--cysteine ligase CoaBC [Actinobacteria bacterium]|nr:bifunctional phosphopantothenoylcysteine decarboxylase/phosphopantothenate--cysteine ligase CoaBC [Actinomycetota bacterium]